MDTRDIVVQLDQEIERLKKARAFLTATPESPVVSRRGGRRPGAGRPKKIRVEAAKASTVYTEPKVKTMTRDLVNA